MIEPYTRRKLADVELLEQARVIYRDRRQPWRRRLYARIVAAAFWVRVRFGWHGDPGRSLRIPVYGRYCGPGTSESTSVAVRDPLDAACRIHDLEYMLARRVDTGDA